MDYLKPTMVARVQFVSESQALSDGALNLDHNAHLRPWQTPAPNNVAGKGKIEVPGHMSNIVWQNRAAAPTQFENALGDALEAAFDGGAETAEQVVAAFNAAAFRRPDGHAWTVTNFEADLALLGA
jgi:hypothetical protein